MKMNIYLLAVIIILAVTCRKHLLTEVGVFHIPTYDDS